MYNLPAEDVQFLRRDCLGSASRGVQLERRNHFLDALLNMGYSVVTKPIKTIFDAKTGTTRKKANLDIEIVFRYV